MKNYLKKRIHLVIRFLMCLSLCIITTLLTIFFDGIGTLSSIFQGDFYFINVPGVLTVLGIVEIAISMYYLCMRKTIGVKTHELIVKKYHCHIMAIGAFFWIIALYKCYEAVEEYFYLTTAVCFVEMLVYYSIVDMIICFDGAYEFHERDTNEGLFEEKAVSEFGELSPSQLEVFYELEDVIRERKRHDSINIALVGQWGYGKSSIINALINKLNEDSNEYFVLKVNALTLQEPHNIIQYVKRYYELLFRKYGVGLPGLNISFFSSLMNIMVDDTGSILEGVKEGFYDLEKERSLFNKQVKMLLVRSGKKNILFFVDDIDRCQDKENIIRLLQEFSEINGLITVVSVDNDTLEEMEGSKSYGLLNKFIHAHVKVESYEEVINHRVATEMLVQAYKRPTDFRDYYTVVSPCMYKGLFFDTGFLCETQNTIKASSYRRKRDLLWDIFVERIKSQIDKGKSIELGYLFNQMFLNYLHSNNRYLCEEEDSIVGIEIDQNSTIEQLSGIGIFLEMLCENFEKVLGEFATFETSVKNVATKLSVRSEGDSSAYLGPAETPNAIDFIKETKLRFDDKHNRVVFSCDGRQNLVVMTSDEWLKFELELNQCYEKPKKIKDVPMLFYHKRLLFNDYVRLTLLLDIVKSIDVSMKNYREYKFALRESSILGYNYIQQLILSWYPSERILDRIRDLSSIVSLQFGRDDWYRDYKMQEFVDDILFNWCVKPAFTDADNEYKKERKLAVVQFKSDIYICISHEEKENDFFVDIRGERKEVNEETEELKMEYEDIRERLWPSDERTNPVLDEEISA